MKTLDTSDRRLMSKIPNPRKIVNLKPTIELLGRYDLEGLISMGAPDDEYEPEAKMILNQLEDLYESDSSINNEIIAQIIANVFNKMFGHLEWGDKLLTAELCLPIAKDLRSIFTYFSQEEILPN